MTRKHLPRWVRGRQVGVAYASVVVMVTIVLEALPEATRDRVVLHASTNLVNLRDRPHIVLVTSAFVLSSWTSLVQMPLIIVGYGEVQRWLGWKPALLAGVLGHVGATLFVASTLLTGINRGRIDLSVATESDVGTSYGLASVAGVLVARVPRRWRPIYLMVMGVYLVYGLVVDRSFTAFGHVTAFAIGTSLASFARVRST